MFGLLCLFTAVSANCETNCYVTCLSKSSLNTCSRACCKFDFIEYEDEKVFYIDGDTKLELELEEVYFEIPKLPKASKVSERPAEYEAGEETEVQAVEIFASKCEEKCSRLCKKTGPKCLEKCSRSHCSTAQVPAGSDSTYTITVLSILGCFVVIALLARPKTYIDGYARLE